MNGKIVAGGIVLIALIFGIGLYYSQTYAYYERLDPDGPKAVIRLTSLASGEAEPVPVENFQGIDAATSPLKFRACFSMSPSIAMLTETYRILDEAEPLVAPGWFGCFDAKEISDALHNGSAVAFMGEENVTYGIDQVVAVMPDGRAFAWHQINRCGEVVFEGKPAPEGCPPTPERE